MARSIPTGTGSLGCTGVVGRVVMGNHWGRFRDDWWGIANENNGVVLLGAVLVLAGVILLLLSVTAVGIKAITDAVTDHVEQRLSRRSGTERPPRVHLSP